MKPINVAVRGRWCVTAWLVGPCLAIVLLGVGMLSATPPSVDVPPDTDTLKPSPGSPPPRFFGLAHLATHPQQALVRKAVQLDPMQSDSLTLEPAGGIGELFGTVEFKDSASRAVAAATYEYREGANGSLKAYSMTGCGGPYESSPTSGGGDTNSGGAS